jgi:hypothetical protein
MPIAQGPREAANALPVARTESCLSLLRFDRHLVIHARALKVRAVAIEAYRMATEATFSSDSFSVLSTGSMISRSAVMESPHVLV